MTSSSTYLAHLPAIFQEPARPGGSSALGTFLLAFEQVLSGLGDVDDPGLDEIIGGIVDETGQTRLAGIHRYCEPGPRLPATQRAPAEFLEWLCEWVAMAERVDADEATQRDFIAQAISLYRLRGTKAGIEGVLRIFTRLGVTVDEYDKALCVGVDCRIGRDTVLGCGAPHFFRVVVRVPNPDPKVHKRYHDIACAIIDLEKPAHCFYRLEMESPRFQVGERSRIGYDTLIKSMNAPRHER